MESVSLILLNAGPGLLRNSGAKEQYVGCAADYSEKIFKDGGKLAVMVAGSEGKDLPFDLDGYENISVIREFGASSSPGTAIRLLEKIGFPCDYVNGLLASIEVILLHNSSAKVNKRIIVFVGESETNIEDIDEVFPMILEKLKAENIVLDLFTHIDIASIKDKAKNYLYKLSELSKKTNGSILNSLVLPSSANSSKHHAIPVVKDESANQPELFSKDSDTNETGAEASSSTKMALRPPLQEEVTVPQLRSTSTRAYLNGTLNITSKLIIPISCYVKTAIHRPASFGKVKRLRGGEPGFKYLIQRTTRVLENDPFTEVQDSEMSYAFEYGGKLLPTDGVDETLLRVDMAKGLHCKGFVRLETIQRHWYSKGGIYVSHLKGNKQAAHMINALITALENNHRGILVHFIYRQTSAPTLCVLTPYKGVEGSFLVMNQIPYADDLRKIQVGDFSKSAKQPSEAQLKVADELISAMMLQKENDNESVGIFCPEETPNPALDRIAQCVMERVSNPNCEIPKLTRDIEKLISHSEEFELQVSGVWNAFKKSFPVVAQDAGNTQEINERDGDDGGEGDYLESNAITTSSIMDSFLERSVSKIDITDPIQTFWSFIGRRDQDFVVPALSQMQQIIKRIVQESQGAQFFGVAGNCVEAFRKACVQYQEGDIFNDYLRHLRQWKSECEQALQFWNLVVVKRNIIPIHQSEWPDSSYTLEEATQFHDTERESNPNAMVEEEAFGSDLTDLLGLVV